MHWTEFPPDAHKGYMLAPATLLVHENRQHYGAEWNAALYGKLGGHVAPRRVYSNLVSFELPMPDFSMPYNVICLSGSVFAFFVGNLFTALTRRFADERANKKRPLAALLHKLKSKFSGASKIK